MAKKRTSIGGDDGSGGQEGTVTVPFEGEGEGRVSARRKGEVDARGGEHSQKWGEWGIQRRRHCHHRRTEAERKVEMLLKTDREDLTQVAFELGEEGDA